MKSTIKQGAIIASLAVAGIVMASGSTSTPKPTTTPTTTSTAASSVAVPTVSFSLSAPKVVLGKSLTQTWSSKNATSCYINGVKVATSGSQAITPQAAGTSTFSFSCSDTVGSTTKTTTATASVVATLPVFKTSYENKNSIPMDASMVSDVRLLGIKPVATGEQGSFERSIAFGDFAQEGKYSAFVATTVSMNTYGNHLADTPGVAYFLRQNASGQWYDASAALIPVASDRRTCITPSYTLVADLNNDGQPDVYISCTGLDFDISTVSNAENTALGKSYAIMYLSQPNGTYKKVEMYANAPIYGHKAALADVDGDGNIDIIQTDVDNPSATIPTCGVPFIMHGHGDGTFTRDDSTITFSELSTAGPWCGYFNVDVVPNNGRQDLMVSTVEGVVWVQGNSNGIGFNFATATKLAMPTSKTYNQTFPFPLDIVYDSTNASFYMHTSIATPNGTDWATVKFSASTGTYEGMVDEHMNSYSYVPEGSQFKPSHSNPGYLEFFTGGCTPTGNSLKSDCTRLIKQ